MKNINEIKLLENLPSSISGDKKIIALCNALENELQLLTEQTKLPLHLPRLDELPHEVLDQLAFQYHVDFYQPSTMSLETKRNLIRRAILQHKKYGTKFAVENILHTFSKEAEISEWYEYEGGLPYHFKLKLQRLRDLEDDGERILELIDITKNVRSWLDAFDFDLTREDKPDQILHFGAAEVTAGKIFNDLNTTFTDKHNLRRVAFDIQSGTNKYLQNFTNNKSRLPLYCGFIHFRHGTIKFKTVAQVDDELWYKLWLNWIKSRWKNYDPAVINFYRDEPIDDDDDFDEETFDGDFIKLWIDFHNDDSTRLFIFKNAREDVTADDINAVNVDGLFINRRGYLSNKVIRAAHSKRSVYKLFF